MTEGDGSVARFTWLDGSTWTSPDGDFTVLAKASDSTYTRTYPDGTVLTFGSSDGRLQSAADRPGNATTYAYNTHGLHTVTDPTGKSFTLAYGYDGKLAWIEDPEGRHVKVTISVAGDLNHIEYPEGVDALRATYDADHRMLTRTDRGGNDWGFAYDFAGRLPPTPCPRWSPTARPCARSSGTPPWPGRWPTW